MPTFRCPSPELPVAQKRAILAQSLYDTVQAIRAVTNVESWGELALFTVIGSTVTDGWVLCTDPPTMTLKDPTGAAGEDVFIQTLPMVGYAMELSVGQQKAAVFFWFVIRKETGTKDHMVFSVGFSPVHGVQWRNEGYVPSVCIHTHSETPSLTKLLHREPNEFMGMFVRDLFKVSLLMNYFTCVSNPESHVYVFSSRASKARITINTFYVDDSSWIEVVWPFWSFRGSQRRIIRSIPELVEWAEKQI